jgi:hypothetical protein
MIRFKVINIMGSGKMMYRMERENKNFKMALIIKENFFMELNLGLDIMFVIQGSLKVNFQMEIFMVMEYLHMLIIVNIMVNGKMD